MAFVAAVSFLMYFTLGDEKSPSLGASAALRKSLTLATGIIVSEGLPREMFDAALSQAESKRKDTEMIGDYRFYTPAIAVKNDAILKELLAATETIELFGGEKMCGGFHPDYSVQWKDQKGRDCYAHLCFGCHEIIFSDGKKKYRYDLQHEAYAKLKSELSAYANKSPVKNR